MLVARHPWLPLLALAACGFHPITAAPTDAPPGGDDAPGDARDGDAPPDGRPGWWSPAWRKRRPVTIDASKLIDKLADFPVLVRLSPSTIDYPAVLDGGADVRFVADDHATELAYDVDTFTRNAASSFWVKVPELAPGQLPAATTIWLYYDNPGATPGAASSATFGAYVSVHHLGNLQDATGNGHTASTASMGTTPSPTGGVVGAARDFDGANDFLVLANSTGSAYDFKTELSVSAWVRADQLDVAYQAIVTKGDKTWRLSRADATSFVGFGTTSGGTNYNLAGTMSIADQQWHHVAITYDGSERAIYVDGVVDAREPFTLAHDSSTFAVSIGRNEESNVGGPRFWDGRIDEVRISATPRGAGWLHAEHLTVMDTSFVIVGAPEDY